MADHMVSALSMLDIDKFGALIMNAKKIGLFGDYDVDGIASVAIWKRFLNVSKIDHTHFLPNRADGYGPSKKGIDFLIAEGVDLILFLDCGSTANQLIANLNVTVLILDHHKVSNFSTPDALINPYRTGQEEYYNLCSTSLSFVAIVYITNKYNKSLDLMSLLDLVCIATIADVMELNLCNRACIRRGLEIINSELQLGLSILINKLKLKRPITSTTLAFYVIPTLNAAGRIAQSELALRLWVSNDPEECSKLSDHLILLNKERRSISDHVFELARNRVNESDQIIIVKDNHWHPGIVGITAGQLREYFNKSAFVFYKSGNYWKGSGRSSNLDLGQLISDSILNGLAETGGGHAAAGGISILEEKFEDWSGWVNTHFKDIDHEPIRIDTKISEFELKCMPTFYDFAPFGRQNPNPCFLLESAWIKDVFVGRNFLQCFLSCGIKLTCFRPGQGMKNGMSESIGRTMDLVLRADEYGETLIYDGRPN